jgi:hypothetical protein
MADDAPPARPPRKNGDPPRRATTVRSLVSRGLLSAPLHGLLRHAAVELQALLRSRRADRRR